MRIVLRNVLVSYLALWILAIGMLPTDAWALLIPSDTQSAVASTQDGAASGDLHAVQRHLEGKLVTQRLAELGLTAEEVQARLADLTDEQLHQLASNLDGLQVGGDPALTFILIFVGAVLLAILFIYAVRPLFVDRHETSTAPVVVEPTTVPPHHH
jgi:hypothetical protein